MNKSQRFEAKLVHTYLSKIAMGKEFQLLFQSQNPDLIREF
jgi:hypothetical protein